MLLLWQEGIKIVSGGFFLVFFFADSSPWERLTNYFVPSK